MKAYLIVLKLKGVEREELYYRVCDNSEGAYKMRDVLEKEDRGEIESITIHEIHYSKDTVIDCTLP